MNENEIKKRLKAMAVGGRKGGPGDLGLMCLACHTASNTLAELQDLIEDAGVPIESVVAAANTWMAGGRTVKERFYIARGRLRIVDFHSGKSKQCIDINMMADFIIPLLK